MGGTGWWRLDTGKKIPAGDGAEFTIGNWGVTGGPQWCPDPSLKEMLDHSDRLITELVLGAPVHTCQTREEWAIQVKSDLIHDQYTHYHQLNEIWLREARAKTEQAVNEHIQEQTQEP